MMNFSYLNSLPLISKDLPGTGGGIKFIPSHFIVEEIPIYSPLGTGEHVHLLLTREGWNTRELVLELAKLFNLKDIAVGCAGLKDKNAKVTQMFSLQIPSGNEETIQKTIETALPVKIDWVKRHPSKLKTGKLLGNRFTIILNHPLEGAFEKAKVIADFIIKNGLPNYYGPQRFGLEGKNCFKALEILNGKGTRQHWMRKLFLSAFQSALFNFWLSERILRGDFSRLIKGDVAKKTDTGGIFDVEEVERENERFLKKEITFTGPIYGKKMRSAKDIAGDYEQKVLEKFEISKEVFHKNRMDGCRRPACLFVNDLKIDSHPEGLLFQFSLPKGAYATTLLREFIKEELPSAPSLTDEPLEE